MTASLAMASRPASTQNAMSWARDSSLSAMLENNIFDHPTPTSFSHLSALLSTSSHSYTSDFGGSLPRLEQNFCQGYSCCGLDLNDLHGLLEHFEEHHVLGTSPAGAMLPPPTTANQRKPVSPALAKKNLLHADMKRKAAAEMAQAQREQLAKKGGPAASATALPAATASGAAPIDPGVPFSMEDDLDMDIGPEEAAPIQPALLPPATTSAAAATAAAFSSANLHQSQTAATRQFSSALRHGLDALSIGSNNFSQTLRRSQSPTASASSPDISTPSTPLMDSDLDDFDPSASSSSLHADLFAPAGTITPSMLLPPQYAHPHALAASADFDTEDEQDPDELAAYHSRRRQPLQPLSAAAGGGAAHLPDFSKNQATIVMGSDPSLTTLTSIGADGAPTAFIAPPPTLPSGRAWVAPAAKPFKCPVPGCDKAYKQQNGLKYHRLHGHCNNRARDGSLDGEDGRETLEEKPYGCYVGAGCGKRYKNMNGLRYHYQHSGPHGQIGLEMLAQGTHPPPLGHVGRSRPGSTASSRNASRNSSPAPTPAREMSAFSFEPQQYTAALH